MESKSREQCKIRKRGNSSSSSSSLVQKYRFKRAIVVGKRGGSTTPVPTWKTTIKSPTLSSLQNTTQPSQTQTGQKPQEASISARKLAASLWEINNIPSPLLRKDNSAQEPIKNREKLPKFPHFSDPSYYTPISEKMDRCRVNGHNKGRKRATAFSKKHQLSDYNGSMMEKETHSKGNAHRECVIGMQSRLKDVSNGLKASKELLKVLNRIWGLDEEEEHSSRMSLVSALGLELNRARTQVDQLIKDQRSSRNEMECLTKHFEEEKAAWKSKERERIRNAIACISDELEVEKKLRRQTERLNKKLGKELAETKASLSQAEKELESVKRAKEKLEQVCDELERGIGEDKAVVEELKRESAKVREEVEKEREMLQLADVLREERVQMKLSEAKYHFEEKNAAVEKLKNELESYIKEKVVVLSKENADDGSPNYQNLQQLEAFLDQIRNDSSERVHDNELLLENQHADDEDGDDSGDSDLHSIELNMDNNSKSYKWSFACEGDDLKRFSIDRDFKGRKSISENIQWGSICLQNRNPNGIDGPDWDLINKTQEKSDAFDFEDEIISYKSLKSLRDHILSGGSVPNFASPTRQWGHSLPGTAASDTSLVKPKALQHRTSASRKH